MIRVNRKVIGLWIKVLGEQMAVLEGELISHGVIVGKVSWPRKKLNNGSRRRTRNHVGKASTMGAHNDRAFGKKAQLFFDRERLKTVGVETVWT